MARFVQMLVKSGVYHDQNFMVVPRGGFNLCYLRDGKDYRLTHDARLDVNVVAFDKIERVAVAYLSTRAGGADGDDRLKALRASMYGSVGKQASGTLLQVRAKGSGIPVLTARHGHAEVKLDVAIMPRKEFTIAFKFLKHENAAKSAVPLTANTPASVQPWVDKLNWIFGAQANVYFRLVGADAPWITIKETVEQPMTTDVFEKVIVAHKHAAADLTCFLVGKYQGKEGGAHAAGTYLPAHKACVMGDAPPTGVFDDGMFDPFIGLMAHEFAHFLGGVHHSRGRLLLNSGAETLDLDKQLVTEINAW